MVSAPFSVVLVTNGKTLRPSSSWVFEAKKLVTELSPPVRILYPSFTFMLRTALTRRSLPIGTADSAARTHLHRLVKLLAMHDKGPCD